MRTTAYSTESRLQILEKVIDMIKNDNRITGLILVGSGAYGFIDRYSDIDLTVPIFEGQDVIEVFRDWEEKINANFDVLQHFAIHLDSDNPLYGFWLNSYYELDMGFISVSKLRAKNDTWKTLVDKKGDLESIMKKSLKELNEPNLIPFYEQRLSEFWYLVCHCVIALNRNQLWTANHFIDIIRNQTVDFAGMNRDLRTSEKSHYRETDQLPNDFLNRLEQSIIVPTEKMDLYNALLDIVTVFFSEVEEFEKKHNFNRSVNVKKEVLDYLSNVNPKSV